MASRGFVSEAQRRCRQLDMLFVATVSVRPRLVAK